MDIIKTYSDEGKSGLKIEGRNALKQLISIVKEGNALFSVILVYNIGRWGRFQDAGKCVLRIHMQKLWHRYPLLRGTIPK